MRAPILVDRAVDRILPVTGQRSDILETLFPLLWYIYYIADGRERAAQAAALGGFQQKGYQTVPEEVQDVMGRALLDAQLDDTPAEARPLKGFGGARVLEIAEDFRGDTYRVVYTVRFPGAIYVLHAFKKKSRRGAETPKRDVDLVRERYRRAEQHFREQGEEDG